MALQSSGQISLLNIASEFGGISPHSLSEYYGVDAGIPSSGEISIGDFYGAAWSPTQSTTLTSSQSWTVPSGITTVRFTLTGATFVPTWTSGWPGGVTGLRFKYTGTVPDATSAGAAFQAWESVHGVSGSLAGSGTRTVSRPLTVSYTLNTGETITVDEYSSRAFGTVNSGSNNVFTSGSTTVRGAYTPWYGANGGYTGVHISSYNIWVSGVYSQNSMELYIPAPTSGSSAPDASMFGYTASGKLSGTANTTGPITISVTPGQSYSFSGGNSYRFSGDQASPFSITSTDASVFLEY